MQNDNCVPREREGGGGRERVEREDTQREGVGVSKIIYFPPDGGGVFQSYNQEKIHT